MTAHPIDTEALRRLADRATPGPWRFNDSTDTRGRKGEFRAPGPHNGFMLVGPWTNDTDAEFIAAARNALPQLLDALDQAEARIKAVEDVLDQAGASINRHPAYTFSGQRMDPIVNGADIRRALDT